jgi:hypothetical protein
MITQTTFFTWFRRNPFGKLLIIAESNFKIFFFYNNFISETYFLTIQRFRKAADKLGDLYTIY